MAYRYGDREQCGLCPQSVEDYVGKQDPVGDAGYADTEELKKIAAQGIKVVVPSQRQALHNREDKPYSKSHFSYDREKDSYGMPRAELSAP